MNATWNVSIRAAALLVLLLPGCTDPETPQYTNKLDRRSPQYVPSPPTKLSVSGLTERNRVFQWQRNSLGEQGFRLERKLGQLGIYTFVCEVPGGTLSYTDTTSMIADTDYTYRILAFAADGLTSAFDSVTVRLLFPAPYDVHVVSNSGDFVRVQWMDSSAEHAGYVVERRTRTTDYRAIATLPPDTMWCTDADLDTTQDYEYRVKAVTGLNASGYSSTSGVMFIPASVDPSLQGQIATSFSAVDDDGVLFVTNTSSGSCSLFNVLTNQVGWSSSQFSLAQAAFSRNGAFLTGRSPDGLVRVIQTSDGNQLQAIPVSSNVNILQLVISDDGKMVAGHDGRNIWGWDTDVGTVVFEVVRTDMGIQSIDLSPDGSTIASAMGTMVKFW
ncbi:MAG TPA: fibronectin type III domain-containing protein, partial [Bacteroidota bacterium]|nr:fibronectin type III domain-containing protein [Bacteroidota bacterium]